MTSALLSIVLCSVARDEYKSKNLTVENFFYAVLMFVGTLGFLFILLGFVFSIAQAMMWRTGVGRFDVPNTGWQWGFRVALTVSIVGSVITIFKLVAEERSEKAEYDKRQNEWEQYQKCLALEEEQRIASVYTRVQHGLKLRPIYAAFVEKKRTWDAQALEAARRQEAETQAQTLAQQTYDSELTRVKEALQEEFQRFARSLALHSRPVTDPEHVLLFFAEAFPQLPVSKDPALGNFRHSEPENRLTKAIANHLPKPQPRPEIRVNAQHLPPPPQWSHDYYPIEYDIDAGIARRLWGDWDKWVLVNGEYQPPAQYHDKIPRKLGTVKAEYEAAKRLVNPRFLQ